MSENKIFADLFKQPTQEELEQMKINRYENYKRNPNNFSNWYESLKDDMRTNFIIPQTQYAVIPIEIMDCLWTDGRPQEATDKIQSYLEKEFEDILNSSKEIFMKTGTFSNKFEFDTCHITDKSQLGEKLYGMYYTGMIYGAVETAEVVLREYIENTDNKPTIYGGMPLRTEFRVFYDFDNKEVLDVINYWHPEVMSEGLLKNFDYNLVNVPYEQILKHKDSLIGRIEELKDEHSKNYKLEKLKDYLTYKEFEPQLIKSFEENKDEVSERVADSLRDNQSLKGKWSLDIMMDGNLFYFIDAAEMNSSALANFVNVN